MDALGIFEGGGAKGLAHVGALAAVENEKISFKGVAGTSAGAIVASLIAVGYSANDLFNPNDENSETVFSVNFLDFFDDGWNDFVIAKSKIAKVFSSKCALTFFINSSLFYLNNSNIIKKLKDNNGLFDTLKFEEYLDLKLYNKLIEQGITTSRPVLFEHIPLPLKIVATDVSNQSLLIFSQIDSPKAGVASAVAGSINLPFFFVPKIIDITNFSNNSNKAISKVKLIDGGLLSNFPAWIFDKERLSLGPQIPTLGFRLVETIVESDSNEIEKGTLLKWSGQIFRTLLNGDPILETREIENLHEIPLRVKVGTLDFQMDRKSKSELYYDGKKSAQEAFLIPGMPKDRNKIEEILKNIIKTFRNGLNINKSIHLRANVVTKTTRGTLRVMYNYGMKDDTDDKLEFPIGSGACSRCWVDKKAVICNLEKAKRSYKKSWRMDKYQQALVRKDLKSLICYPILDLYSNSCLGVLNIDSSDNILDLLKKREVGVFMDLFTRKLAEAF